MAIEAGEVAGLTFLASVDQLAQLPAQRDTHAALALAVEQEVAVVQIEHDNARPLLRLGGRRGDVHRDPTGKDEGFLFIR